jgi:phage shock protein PspC (stress-responsive transcriptional regulator)
MDITMNVTESSGPEPARSPNPNAPSNSAVLPPKRIYRDPSGPIGGVAGGFAGYFDIDPVIARLLWIVALFSGIGIPAYFVCWLIIPKAKEWPAPGYGRLVASGTGQHNTALLSGFVIIGLVAAVGTGVDGVGEYLLPAALIGFGVYLLGQRPSSSATLEANAPAPDLERLDAPLARPAYWATASESTPSQRAGLVTPTVLSVLAIAIGILGALRAADLIHMPIASVAAVGLVIVGAGLLASLWLGRARGLVPLGLVLVGIMLAASSFGSWFESGHHGRSPRERAVDSLMGAARASASTTAGPHASVGDHSYAPATLEELESEYEVGMGNLSVDLRRIDFTGQTRDLELSVGMGNLTVIVPSGTAVNVEGEVGAGEANTLGRASSGLGFDVQTEDNAAGAGQLNIEFDVGMGKVEVRRDSL